MHFPKSEFYLVHSTYRKRIPLKNNFFVLHYWRDFDTGLVVVNTDQEIQKGILYQQIIKYLG